MVTACLPRRGPSEAALPGVSTAGGPTHRAAADAGPHGDAGIPADFHTSFAHVSKRFTSGGHAAGRFDVEIWANDAGAAAFAAERGEAPAGAMLIKEHFERDAQGKPGPTMMMEKRARGFDPPHGDWRYVVVTAAGEVVADGAVPTCVGCHDDAPHDHLFKALE